MTREEVMKTLEEIVLDILEDEDIESVAPDDHFIDDLDMDSLQAVSMLIHIEKRLKVSIPESELKGFRNLAAVTDVVMGYLEPAMAGAVREG